MLHFFCWGAGDAVERRGVCGDGDMYIILMSAREHQGGGEAADAGQVRSALDALCEAQLVSTVAGAEGQKKSQLHKAMDRGAQPL